MELSNQRNITIIVEGRPEDGGDVRLEDFTEQLDNWKKLLTEADRLVTGRQSVYYRIADLRHQSPATVVLEPVPIPHDDGAPSEDRSAEVAAMMVRGMVSLQSPVAVDEVFDYPALSAFRAVAVVVGEKIGSLRVVTDSADLKVERIAAERVDELVRTVEQSFGSVTGYIEKLNIHARSRIFSIYPIIGPEKIACKFHNDLRDEVIGAVGRYATVHGLLRYRARDIYPHEMVQVTEIEVHPPKNELPDMALLRGQFQYPTEEVEPFGW